MSWITDLSNKITSAVKTVTSVLYVTNPLTTSAINQSQRVIENPVKELTTSAAIAGTIATGFAAVANPAAALSVAKAVGKFVLDKPGTAAILGAGTIFAPAVYGAATSSDRLKEMLKEGANEATPDNTYQFGKDVGAFIENPSADKLTKIAKENPVLIAAIAAAVLLVGGKALQVYNSWKTSQATEDIAKSTEAAAEAAKNAAKSGKDNVTDSIVNPGTPQVINIYTAAPTPTTVAEEALPTTVVAKKTTKKKKKAAKKKKKVVKKKKKKKKAKVYKKKKTKKKKKKK